MTILLEADRCAYDKEYVGIFHKKAALFCSKMSKGTCKMRKSHV